MHLSIAGNSITSLAGIESLTALQWLDASCNRIKVGREDATDLLPIGSVAP